MKAERSRLIPRKLTENLELLTFGLQYTLTIAAGCISFLSSQLRRGDEMWRHKRLSCSCCSITERALFAE